MNNINMNIQQISNNDILSVILINLNITDILSLRLTNLFFYEILSKQSILWDILAKKYLNPKIKTIFKTNFRIFQQIGWGFMNQCAHCGNCLLKNNKLDLIICSCHFHNSRLNFYLKYHHKCLKYFKKNTMYYGTNNRDRTTSFILYCPLCNDEVVGINSNLY